MLLTPRWTYCRLSFIHERKNGTLHGRLKYSNRTVKGYFFNSGHNGTPLQELFTFRCDLLNDKWTDMKFRLNIRVDSGYIGC